MFVRFGTPLVGAEGESGWRPTTSATVFRTQKDNRHAPKLLRSMTAALAESGSSMDGPCLRARVRAAIQPVIASRSLPNITSMIQ